MALKLRQYEERDREQLLELWTNIFNDTGSHNDPEYILTSKLAIDENIYVASEQDASHKENITGVIIAGYDGHRGWLYSLAVEKKLQRNGIGRQLVEFAVEKLRSMGCAKVNLQVREENKEVISFYRALGFKVENRISMGKLLSDTT
jgi:ribosomal protein S18 acetylase RimI-like enzyme